MRKYTIGWKEFGDKVDITDPCYDRNTWCRMNAVKIKPGNYECLVWKHGDKYTRIGIIGIYLDGEIPVPKDMTEIGSIGVDAGLAGFFVNKPDYGDKEWKEFCDSIYVGNEKAWLRDVGFFSKTGYGDGEYPVMASKNESGEIVALEIRFM